MNYKDQAIHATREITQKHFDEYFDAHGHLLQNQYDNRTSSIGYDARMENNYVRKVKDLMSKHYFSAIREEVFEMVDDLIRDGAPDGNMLRKHSVITINDEMENLAIGMFDHEH